MNYYYYFLGHEYRFIMSLSAFNRLRDIKKIKKIVTLPPETPAGICPRHQTAVTIALQSLFPL